MRRRGHQWGDLAEPGHAEVVLVEFDEARLKYHDLLDMFWRIHDPTQINRQGHDVGSQYRSIIFAMDDQQEAEASAAKAHLEAIERFTHPIATEITRADLARL